MDEGEPGDPRSVPAGHGWRWLKEGLGHFRANPLAWILALLAWLAISLVLSIIPLIGTIATTLLSAVVTGGYMIGCQAQERGEAFTVSHLFSGFHQNSGQLLLVGLLYLVGMVVIMFGVFALAGGAAFMMMGDPEAMQDPAAVEAMMSSFYLPLLLAMGLMIPLVMAYWFAPALVALDGLSAIAAMRLSFMGCLKNILPFLLYGLVLFLVMIIAVIPVGLGLLVAIPAMIASVYTGYRDIYYD
ncbi:MAG: hypothetical protein B0D96_06625 [Candidatus Sedimenticola endophacoides]|uniref:Transmembrane protein n=1 Tax=Candidatus Sedimenticola endophacoides TaxID=2548426 RepID=A0A657Q6P4_9GAMM|nr:MAG: hypothetical protein B0D94_08965 [Candidatus Sedimenticola endophacoides]OQX35529.1 MAG: hypothetical protein B0D96_06625 [Candidatus Sedimenticola endophacoides]OQX37945.1 MAG: hypothetical protein B0D84_00170 [Candidatus Sedimenticola endophacoides]OQX40688.1 MAG: hypothetical protein B0D89_06855 [Candidatus Sedimenticola endophacoides]OQX42490.1 MAG: hypothetical protein B0D88_06550 [Candidatus Sedimenticola endophacoides]